MAASRISETELADGKGIQTDGKMNRGRAKLVVVAGATLVCLYLSYLLSRPFLPAVIWAVTGAVITHSIVRWLGTWIRSPTWRAAVTVTVVSVAVFAPVLGLVYLAAGEIGQALNNWQPAETIARWEEALSSYPRLAAAWKQISTNVDVTRVLEQVGGTVQGGATAIVTGVAYSLVQALIALFILYYLFRDEGRALASVRELSPFTDVETDNLLNRVGDTIHATINGTVVVAVVQGALGGVIFWILGLPGALLWGIIMAMLAIVPYLGAFVVWAPAAVYLFSQGETIRAAVLVVWGTVVVGLIDNLLYPILVGNRLRQHTVISFLAIIGGITVFGASGIVLGPVIVTLTFFLLETWRRRTVRAT